MEFKNYSDTKLLELISKNNFKALEELYNRYYKLLFTLIFRICNDNVLAEQILLQVFLIIFKKAKFFPIESDNAYAWIVLLARNRAVDSVRRNRTSEEIEIYYNDDFENQYIIPTLCAEVDALDIETALHIENDFKESYKSLTEMQKTVIEYAFFDGLTIDEIVAKLKLSNEMIRKKIVNSILALRDKLVKKESDYSLVNSVTLEFISAFSLGCLKRENFDVFINYYNAGKLDYYSLKLFGELQNIVALLPLNLDVVEVENNILDKIKEELLKSGQVFNDEIEEKKEEQNTNENIVDNKEIKKDESIEYNINVDNLREEKTEIKKDVSKDAQVKLTNPLNVQNIKNNKLLYVLLAINLFLIVLFIVISFLFNSRLNSLKERLEIAEEKSEIASKFASDYREFIDFTNYGSYKTILLKDSTNFVVARLFISLNANKALLQVDNLPKIQSDEEYYLFAVKNGTSTKIINFDNLNKKYISINIKEGIINSDLFKISINSKKSKNMDGTPLYFGN